MIETCFNQDITILPHSLKQIPKELRDKFKKRSEHLNQLANKHSDDASKMVHRINNGGSLSES